MTLTTCDNFMVLCMCYAMLSFNQSYFPPKQSISEIKSFFSARKWLCRVGILCTHTFGNAIHFFFFTFSWLFGNVFGESLKRCVTNGKVLKFIISKFCSSFRFTPKIHPSYLFIAKFGKCNKSAKRVFVSEECSILFPFHFQLGNLNRMLLT